MKPPDPGSEGLTLPPGTRLGPYEILAFLASGGMGEVYRARDERLGREVAVKVLHGEASADPDRIRRFEQEAKAAGALNHPNVLAVFDTGRHEGSQYLVFELLDGTTLERRLGPGPLPVRKAVDYAAQIAQGLAAAHEQGIVHRDLKPENLFVTRDGRVKILDFGLAKLRPRLDADASRQDGATVSAITDAGTVLGTVGYMSPEQVKGEPADHRSDIFGLGSVLHEMLSGRRAFGGDTAAEVMTAILKQDPPELARPGIPAGLERVVRRCLEKRPEERFQSARDLAFALEALSQVTGGERVNGQGRRFTGRWVTAAAALVMAATAALLLIRSRSRVAAPPAGPKVVSLTSFPGREIDPALSPDGRQVAFAWDGGAPGGAFDIYVMLIGAGAPLRLTAQAGRNTNPSWSPDGRSVAFTRALNGETGLYLVPSLGGAERKLATLALGQDWYGLSIPTAWSPDGRFLAFQDRTSLGEPPALFLLSPESLERRRLTSPPAGGLGDWSPAFAPDGASLAFIRQGEGVSQVFSVPVAGGQPAPLTSDEIQALGGLGWTGDGHDVVFSSDRDGVWSLWRVPAQGGRTERLGVGQASGGGGTTISLQGDRLAYVQSSDDLDIWRLDLKGSGGARAAPGRWMSTTRFEGAPQYSPDGARVAFESTRSGPMEIWTCRSDGSNPLQLTFLGKRFTGTPRWSPDGREIAFDARLHGHSQILVVSAEGGTPRPVTNEAFNDWVPSWSRDGRRIYFASDRSGRREVWKIPVGGGQAVQVTRQGGFAAFESPDGRSVYYSQFDAPGIFTVPVGGGEERPVLEGLTSGFWGYWAVVDTGLFFVDAAATSEPLLRFFDFASRRVVRSATLGKELARFDSGLTVSPDSSWALYVRFERGGSDLMLVENLH